MPYKAEGPCGGNRKARKATQTMSNESTHNGTDPIGRPATRPDDSAILDGPQGIAARLRDLPDGFADFAHSYVADLLHRARDRELYDDVERKVGEWLRCGFDEIGIGPVEPVVRNPNRGSAAESAMMEADEHVELALHAIIDTMLDAYQLQDVALDEDATLDAVDQLRATIDLTKVGDGWAS